MDYSRLAKYLHRCYFCIFSFVVNFLRLLLTYYHLFDSVSARYYITVKGIEKKKNCHSKMLLRLFFSYLLDGGFFISIDPTNVIQLAN